MYDDTGFSNPFAEMMAMLHEAKIAFFKAFSTALEDTGLNYTQVFVLAALRISDRPLAVSEIAHFLSIEAHTASELVARMEKKGYLEKTTSTDDKRYVRIRLSAKGIESADEAGRRILLLCKRISSSFPPEQLEQFNKCLRSLRNLSMQEVGMEIMEVPAYLSVHRINKWVSQTQDEQSSPPDHRSTPPRAACALRAS